MTEKRFTIDIIDDENWLIEDAETGLDYNPIDGVTRVLKGLVDLVNNLYEENEQLKQSYKEFEDECQSTFNAMNRKQNDLYRKNFKLKEENEQLKKQNKELEKFRYSVFQKMNELIL